MLDLLRSLTRAKTYLFEVYGNFLLQHTLTGKLSPSHGKKFKKDIIQHSDVREDSDFHCEVQGSADIEDLASGLVTGRYTKHFEKIFKSSKRKIVALMQVVVCCDYLSIGGQRWQIPGKIQHVPLNSSS